MKQLGLKLWSSNVQNYLEPACRLYANGLFSYIELYIVPGTLHTLETWKSSGIPFAIHASHFAHGVNLAVESQRETNAAILKESLIFHKKLNASYLVFHGGMNGEIEETIRQMKQFQEPNMLIENKPYRPPHDMNLLCRGAIIEEIGTIIEKTGYGFCLDVGHAICTANALELPPYQYLERFQELTPFCYHISDNKSDSTCDAHMHIGDGDYDLRRIFSIIDASKPITLEIDKNCQDNLDDFEGDVRSICEF